MAIKQSINSEASEEVIWTMRSIPVIPEPQQSFKLRFSSIRKDYRLDIRLSMLDRKTREIEHFCKIGGLSDWEKTMYAIDAVAGLR